MAAAPPAAPESAPTGLRRRAEAVAAAIPALLLAAERLAASALPGAHGERRAGIGEAFWQYRPAQPGDTASRIDWRRSARSDTAFLREREAQSPRQAVLWVDPGAGMAWRGGEDRPEKADRARLLALAFGLAALRGGERVGVLGGAARSGRAQANVLAEALFEPRALMAAGLRPGARVVILSDFLGADLAVVEGFLSHAAGLGVGGALLQVLDPAEEGFPYAGAVDFLDDGGAVAHRSRDAEGLRGAYLDRLAARRQALERLALGAGWRFGMHDTASSPAAGLIWLAGAVGMV